MEFGSSYSNLCTGDTRRHLSRGAERPRAGRPGQRRQGRLAGDEGPLRDGGRGRAGRQQHRRGRQQRRRHAAGHGAERGRARRAVAVAKANDGVKSVVDQLRIAPATAARRQRRRKVEGAAEKAADKTASAANKTGRAIDDGWIKSKIYAQYLTDWNTVLDDSDIDVDVKDNVVTLNGTVKSAEAKTKAVATAKSTDGVKSVNDMLRVAAH